MKAIIFEFITIMKRFISIKLHTWTASLQSSASLGLVRRLCLDASSDDCSGYGTMFGSERYVRPTAELPSTPPLSIVDSLSSDVRGRLSLRTPSRFWSSNGIIFGTLLQHFISSLQRQSSRHRLLWW